MSRIAGSWLLLPEAEMPVEDRVYDVYDPPLVVPRTRSIATETTALVALPDRRAYRSIARNGVMLCAVGLASAGALAPWIAADPYRAGIYCALDNGNQNYEGARELARSPASEFAARFKQLNHPKRYLSQLVNLPAAHLGIFLGLRGPVNVYCHSTAAVAHALDQAGLDLETGVVDAALVCSAFALDDPLLALRARLACPAGTVLSEGAAAVLLVSGDGGDDPFPIPEPVPGGDCHGLAQPLIDLARRAAPAQEALSPC